MDPPRMQSAAAKSRTNAFSAGSRERKRQAVSRRKPPRVSCARAMSQSAEAAARNVNRKRVMALQRPNFRTTD